MAEAGFGMRGFVHVYLLEGEEEEEEEEEEKEEKEGNVKVGR